MHLNLQARMDNTRRTIQTEVGLVRDIVGDVRDRFDLDPVTEPQSTRFRGGVLGQRGSLLKTPVDFAIKTLDNLVQHQQEFARINRQVVGAQGLRRRLR